MASEDDAADWLGTVEEQAKEDAMLLRAQLEYEKHEEAMRVAKEEAEKRKEKFKKDEAKKTRQVAIEDEEQRVNDEARRGQLYGSYTKRNKRTFKPNLLEGGRRKDGKYKIKMF